MPRTVRPSRLLAAAGPLVLLALPSAAAAAAPSLRFTAGSYPFGRDRAAIQGQAWKVGGVLRGAGEGGTVIVRLYRGSRVATVSRPKVGAGGSFVASFRVRRAGPLAVEVVRPASGGGPVVRAGRANVWVIDPAGRSGPSMRFLQQRLTAAGYWPGLSGGYDLRTRWAIMAFRKVNSLARNFAISKAIFLRVARGSGRFRPKYGATGRQRVEADLSRQVYALITARGRVYRTVPTSSGKPSTPSDLGRFRFYSKTPGVNSLGMVDAVYYNGGEAVHGYPDIPSFPASHGCLRTPTTYARSIMNWLRLGDRIDVYR